MTVAQLEKRLAALETQVRELKAQLREQSEAATGRSWLEDAGMFKDDPFFEEAVQAGKAYRESLKPGRKGKKTSPTGKKHAHP